jgi:DNA-directed RNA polymerase subunit RPC12/RpoP
MSRILKDCVCSRCGARWRDFPGQWAMLTRPQYEGDTRNGCPNCRHLYWTEIDAIGDRSPSGPGRATGPVHESPGAGTAIAQTQSQSPIS